MKQRAIETSAALLAVFLCFLASCAGESGDDDSLDPDDDIDDSGDDDDDDDDDNDDNDDDDDDDNDDDDDDTPPVLTTAEGDVYRFDPSFTMLDGAQISVLERPDLDPVISDDNGHFAIEGLHAGDELTLLSDHFLFYPTQTATVILPPEGLFDLTVMTPPTLVVRLLSLVLLTRLDPNACQIAVTVSPAGGNPFTPGIAGASVSIDPPLDPAHGPFYFMYIDLPNLPPIDIPVRGLTETTDDGGAVFVNVPPGEYVLSATMDETQFTQAFIKCRPGVLVDASPPYGLQVIEP